MTDDPDATEEMRALTRDELQGIVAAMVEKQVEEVLRRRRPGLLSRLLMWWIVGVASAVLIEGNVRTLYFSVITGLLLFASAVYWATSGFWKQEGIKTRDKVVVVLIAWTLPVFGLLADVLHRHHSILAPTFGLLMALVAVAGVPYAGSVDDRAGLLGGPRRADGA